MVIVWLKTEISVNVVFFLSGLAREVYSQCIIGKLIIQGNIFSWPAKMCDVLTFFLFTSYMICKYSLWFNQTYLYDYPASCWQQHVPAWDKIGNL